MLRRSVRRLTLVCVCVWCLDGVKVKVDVAHGWVLLSRCQLADSCCQSRNKQSKSNFVKLLTFGFFLWSSQTIRLLIYRSIRTLRNPMSDTNNDIIVISDKWRTVAGKKKMGHRSDARLVLSGGSMSVCSISTPSTTVSTTTNRHCV